MADGSLLPRAVIRRGNGLAFDRASVRSYSKDGHLHVAITPISKANVCPYYGREIPDFDKLGLDPDKVYKLFRDPEELAKGAATFNGKPLLMIHKPVSAEEHPREITIGSTGTDAVFQAPYLMNSLSIWDDEVISAIESEEQNELSSAYHYVADMTPGDFEGEHYDGVMREIVGNHVALVEEGRAGPDVVVQDAKPKGLQMKIKTANPTSRKALMVQGAVVAYLAPKLAADAQIDLSGVFSGVNRKTFDSKREAIVSRIEKAVKGKLAQDADLEDIVELIDALKGAEAGDDDEISIDADIVEGATGNEDPEGTNIGLGKDSLDEETMAMLKGKLDDETYAKVVSALAPATNNQGADEDPAEKKKDDDPPKVAAEDCDKPMTKGAMDAAIKVAEDRATKRTIARMHAIDEAKRLVEPHIGEVVAMDSAEAIYKMALDNAIDTGLVDLDLNGIAPSAYKAMVALLPKPTDTPAPRLGLDAAAAKSLADRFPGADRIKNLG